MSRTCPRCYKIVTDPCQSDTESLDCQHLQNVTRCDQCASTTVNGHFIHERGCPNDTKECRGCFEQIPAHPSIHYCVNCRS